MSAATPSTATMNGASSGRAWSYAVPLEETDGNARPLPPRSPQRNEHELEHEWDENAAKALDRRSSAWDLQSDSETAKQRKTSVRAVNHTAVRKRSRNTLRENKQQQSGAASKAKASGPGSAYTPSDDSAWIHRDKLAQIEIQEMEEAGIYIRPSRRSQSLGPGRENGRVSRSMSRTSSRKALNDQSNGAHYDDDYAAAYPAHGDHERIHASNSATAFASNPEATSPKHPPESSQPPSGPVGHASLQDAIDSSSSRPSNDHNSPESSQPSQQASTGRPSTSRIPVSRNTAVPVPHDVVERDSPLPRSRAGSQTLSGSWDDAQYARARSGSVSSQMLLDSDHDRRRITPPEGINKRVSGEDSPQKARVQKQTPPGRKVSTPASGIARPGSSAGKRVTSGSATRRPGSSSGHKSRPSTGAFTPEGDPPWIASMYKPDPRLPPDQQMIPTHAKRMMQEQWEKEGKTGTVYDRDFNLLNDEDLRPKRPISDQPNPNPHNRGTINDDANMANGTSSNDASTGNGWPLGLKSEGGSIRHGNSAGYRITPTISSAPTMQRPGTSEPAPPQRRSTAQDQPLRVPELDEKEEPKPKKACCCVVM
ncbi:hypothetical protein CERZMDRAFT_88493 [Cercospora zeae-maydis SCOH1-5]|uniref:TeaA receptor TeaR n=1 Tax=Cercospora zeae-maydis SCOH1-5 TaxID=717836 RepID=A0A6A6F109_9PEZI|nr:hypothetical protein CERZMDRAFT_88493 [Cercospora zeae-maydis SCOH1-5]